MCGENKEKIIADLTEKLRVYESVIKSFNKIHATCPACNYGFLYEGDAMNGDIVCPECNVKLAVCIKKIATLTIAGKTKRINGYSPEPFTVIHKGKMLSNTNNLTIIYHQEEIRGGKWDYIDENERDVYKHVTTGDIFLYHIATGKITRWNVRKIVCETCCSGTSYFTQGFNHNMVVAYFRSLDQLPPNKKDQNIIKKYATENHLIDVIQKLFPDYYVQLKRSGGVK